MLFVPQIIYSRCWMHQSTRSSMIYEAPADVERSAFEPHGLRASVDVDVLALAFGDQVNRDAAEPIAETVRPIKAMGQAVIGYLVMLNKVGNAKTQ
jgi:hypothetical protein